jgi:glutathione S-transferase
MYRLHTSPGSGGFAVHAMLEELGVKYALVHVDTRAGQHRTRAFLRLNPLAQVPVLEVPGGRVMTESAAMMVYLADRHASPRLAPAAGSAARAGFLRWLLFFAVNVYSSDLRFFYAERYTTDPKGAAGVKEAGLAAMNREFAIIDKAIGPSAYMLGARYSALDPYLAMLAHWHPDPAGLFATCKNIARVAEKVKARKAIRAIAGYHKLW